MRIIIYLLFCKKLNGLFLCALKLKSCSKPIKTLLKSHTAALSGIICHCNYKCT